MTRAKKIAKSPVSPRCAGPAAKRMLPRPSAASSKTARDDANLLPAIIPAVAAGVTEGEIMGALRDEWGEYVDPGVF